MRRSRRVGAASLVWLAGTIAVGAGTVESTMVAVDRGATVTLPLKHTEVVVDIAGFVASVEVTQVFANEFERPVEATYVFPLPDTAAVDGLVVQTGNRTIRGTIQRREDARATYARARRAGRMAALLDQERGNVFTQRLANLVPRAQVAVRLHYTVPLAYDEGRYTFLFPMLVAERYTPPAASSTPTPPQLPPGTRAGHDIALTVRLDAGVPIESLESPSHAVEVERTGPAQAVVTLAAGDRIPNKDFVLQYAVAGDRPRLAVLAHRTENDGHFLLVLQPEAQPAADEIAPKELILLLDVSGSMDGPPLAMVKALAADALGRLGPRDRFDVVAFSETTRLFESEPVDATADTIARGQEFVRGLTVESGTELLGGLRKAVRLPAAGDLLRIVVLLTDAEVSNDDQVLTIEHELGATRVFVVGVGSAVNHSLGRRLASAGRGVYEHLRPDGDAVRTVDRLFRLLDHPYLTDLSIDWGRLRVAGIEPDPLPDVYAGRPFVLAGRYEWGGSDTVIVRGRLGGVPWEQRVEVELPERESAHEALPKLWARQAIDRLELQAALSKDAVAVAQANTMIEELALTFGLLTRFTSFVAVDEEEVANPGGEFDAVQQAVPRPDLTERVVVQCQTRSVVITSRAFEELPVSGSDYQAGIATSSYGGAVGGFGRIVATRRTARAPAPAAAVSPVHTKPAPEPHRARPDARLERVPDDRERVPERPKRRAGEPGPMVLPPRRDD